MRGVCSSRRSRAVLREHACTFCRYVHGFCLARLFDVECSQYIGLVPVGQHGSDLVGPRDLVPAGGDVDRGVAARAVYQLNDRPWHTMKLRNQEPNH